MKVAIIGASGFVGTRLLEKWSLLRRFEPRAVVRRPASLAAIARFQLDYCIADALDQPSLTAALEGCDAVVHAAIGDPKQIERMPEALVRSCQEAKVRRIVYLSTASVHGQNPAPGTSESSPLSDKQSIEYNNAKVRAERSFFQALEKSALSGCALRPGVVFGPRSRWVYDLAMDFIEGRAFLINEGRGICNSIYIDNLVHAIELCLDAGDLPPASYLVGDSETVAWRDFYAPIAEAVGKSLGDAAPLDPPVFSRSLKQKVDWMLTERWVQSLLPLVPGRLKRVAKAGIEAWPDRNPPSSWRLDSGPVPQPTEEQCALQQCSLKLPSTKAKEELGYQPAVSFATGMARSVAWLEFCGLPVQFPRKVQPC